MFGSEGTLSIPDPNTFGGISSNPFGPAGEFVHLRRGAGEFEEIPVRYGYVENSRGLGLADFAWCIQNGGNPRVNGEGSLHVLEMMLGVLESSKTGKHYKMTTTCQKPTGMYDDVPFEKE